MLPSLRGVCTEPAPREVIDAALKLRGHRLDACAVPLGDQASGDPHEERRALVAGRALRVGGPSRNELATKSCKSSSSSALSTSARSSGRSGLETRVFCAGWGRLRALRAAPVTSALAGAAAAAPGLAVGAFRRSPRSEGSPAWPSGLSCPGALPAPFGAHCGLPTLLRGIPLRARQAQSCTGLNQARSSSPGSLTATRALQAHRRAAATCLGTGTWYLGTALGLKRSLLL